MELAHSNWRELTTFVRDLSEELMTPQGKIKPEFVTINSALQEAVMQFWAETTEIVEKEDGTAVHYGYGISNMTPKDWFNNDLKLRQNWANVIEAAYKRYQVAVLAETSQKNEIAEELEAVKSQLAQLTEAMNKQMADNMKADEKQTAADTPKDDEEAEAEAGIKGDEEAEGEA